LPWASGGQFWGDGATYYSMAWSLAEDVDLRYEAGDLARVKREFPGGPQGIFLKRTGEGAERGIFFAKAFSYPLLAAPFVRVLGTRGLLVANALCLGLALAAAFVEARRRAGPGTALVVAAALLL